MEHTFKRDVLKELRVHGGCVLLHDEIEERPGVFSIIPIWQEATEADIMTPRNVFELMVKEGYRVRHRVFVYGTLLTARRLTIVE